MITQFPAGDIKKILVQCNFRRPTNKKFLLLVMCTLAFSVYAADDSYVVVPRQAGVIYKNEDDQEIGYTVRDERGTELSAWFFKKDYTYASKTSKNGSTMCLQGTTLYVHHPNNYLS
ncbi:MAG: hypothetical protein LVQ75_04575 [Candidatus Babeliales bacterium]|jgi:hypothetical protein